MAWSDYEAHGIPLLDSYMAHPSNALHAKFQNVFLPLLARCVGHRPSTSVYSSVARQRRVEGVMSPARHRGRAAGGERKE